MPVTRPSASSRSAVGDLPALHGALQRRLEPGLHLRHPVGAAGPEHHVVAAAGADLDDPGRHRAGADHAHPPHRPGRPGHRAHHVAVGHDLGRAGAGVGVDAATGLAPEQPGRDVLLEQRRGGVPVVAGLPVHRLEDLVGAVQPDQVEQRQRPHRVPAAQAHRGVDVLAGGVARLVHPDRVVEVAEQQRVRDEAGPVPDGDVELAAAVDERLHVGDHLGVADDGADHLDQVHHRGRVEPVQPDHLRRPARRRRQVGHRQGGGVGGQHGVGRQQRVQLGEQRLLDLQLLRDRLHHQVAVGEGRQAAASGDPPQDRVRALLVELAPLHRAGQRAGQPGPAALDRRLVRLDADHVDARARQHLDDAGTHRAQADHPDPAELPCHHVPPRLGCEHRRHRLRFRTGSGPSSPARAAPGSPAARR